MNPVRERVRRAQSLCQQAEALQTIARATRALIHAEQRRHPVRRLYRVARGASDEPIHTREYQCPHCGETERLAPDGHVLAAGGFIYAHQRCGGCNRVFVFVRRGRQVLRGQPTSPPAEPPAADPAGSEDSGRPARSDHAG